MYQFTSFRQDIAERISVCTPAAVQGETHTHVVFLALQRRDQDETTPRGHCTQEARRLVALTRASRTLVVLGENLHKSDIMPTCRLQNELSSSEHHIDVSNHEAS